MNCINSKLLVLLRYNFCHNGLSSSALKDQHLLKSKKLVKTGLCGLINLLNLDYGKVILCERLEIDYFSHNFFSSFSFLWYIWNFWKYFGVHQTCTRSIPPFYHSLNKYLLNSKNGQARLWQKWMKTQKLFHGFNQFLVVEIARSIRARGLTSQFTVWEAREGSGQLLNSEDGRQLKLNHKR